LRKTLATTAASLTIAAFSLGAIAPASAYDRELFGYAASHMINRSDIPKALGELSDNLNFFANSETPNTRIFICALSEKQVGLKVVASNFAGSYSTEFDRKIQGPQVSKSVQVSVYHFNTTSAASKAYNKIETRAKKCKGTQTTTTQGTDGLGGAVVESFTSTTTLRNGLTTVDIVNGRRGVYIESDYLGESTQVGTGETSKFFSDNFVVFALTDDVIVQTQFNSNERLRLSKVEIAAVEQLAITAVRAWRG
jgi:hypothetical protein